MAKRKQVAVEETQTAVIEEDPPADAKPALAGAGGPRASVATAAVDEMPENEQPQRQWRVDPFPVKTVNLDGYKLQLQESRNSDAGWQMQIKFGAGSRDDMPSDAVREFIKSQRLAVTTRAGEEKQVQMFHWNDSDRAWGMRIDFNAPATSRQKAERVFKEVVELVAQERGAVRER